MEERHGGVGCHRGIALEMMEATDGVAMEVMMVAEEVFMEVMEVAKEVAMEVVEVANVDGGITKGRELTTRVKHSQRSLREIGRAHV